MDVINFDCKGKAAFAALRRRGQIIPRRAAEAGATKRRGG
jgi:hypothetical protein